MIRELLSKPLGIVALLAGAAGGPYFLYETEAGRGTRSGLGTLFGTEQLASDTQVSVDPTNGNTAWSLDHHPSADWSAYSAPAPNPTALAMQSNPSQHSLGPNTPPNTSHSTPLGRWLGSWAPQEYQVATNSMNPSDQLSSNSNLNQFQNSAVPSTAVSTDGTVWPNQNRYRSPLDSNSSRQSNTGGAANGNSRAPMAGGERLNSPRLAAAARPATTAPAQLPEAGFAPLYPYFPANQPGMENSSSRSGPISNSSTYQVPGYNPNASPWEYQSAQPATLRGNQQSTLVGGGISDLREVIRFDVTPGWVLQRFVKAFTTVTEDRLDAIRVPLITGNTEYDLDGTLTYFFDPQHELKRVQLHATTGNASPIVQLMEQYYHLNAQPSLGGHLYTTGWNRVVTGLMHIAPANQVTNFGSQSRYRITLELNQPSMTYGLSKEATELLKLGQDKSRWQ